MYQITLQLPRDPAIRGWDRYVTYHADTLPDLCAIRDALPWTRLEAVVELRPMGLPGRVSPLWPLA